MLLISDTVDILFCSSQWWLELVEASLAVWLRSVGQHCRSHWTWTYWSVLLHFGSFILSGCIKKILEFKIGLLKMFVYRDGNR